MSQKIIHGITKIFWYFPYLSFTQIYLCIGIICRYFVGHESCVCILSETWSLKIYEKYVWVFCEECVCKIYGNVR